MKTCLKMNTTASDCSKEQHTLIEQLDPFGDNTWRLQPQNERCQLTKAHMSSGEITGERFQSLKYLVQKYGTFSNLGALFSVT